MSEWTEGAKVKSLEKIEKDLHSIDVSLDRIATALEKLTAIQYIVDNVDPCEKGDLKEPTEVKNEDEWPGNV